MKEIKLTKGKVALVDDNDYEWLNQWKWIATPTKNHFYASRAVHRSKTIKASRIYMHRLILGLTDRKHLCDHIDRDSLNNQRSNLRVATFSQNRVNCIRHKQKSSKYLGLSLDKRYGKWMAKIMSNGRVIYLGTYKDEDEAAIAYNKAAIELHGEFANLNKIET